MTGFLFALFRRFPTPIRLVDFVDVVGGYKNKDFNDLREEFQVSRSHDQRITVCADENPKQLKQPGYFHTKPKNIYLELPGSATNIFILIH